MILVAQWPLGLIGAKTGTSAPFRWRNRSWAKIGACIGLGGQLSGAAAFTSFNLEYTSPLA